MSNLKNRNMNSATQRIVGIAVFSALAFIVAMFCSPIPKVGGFLSLEVKDAIITISAFIYGPFSAVVISLVSALIEFLTIGSETGWFGLVMNFASSATFSLTASLIYSSRRSFKSSIVGIYTAVVATTAVMYLMNTFVTPWYLVDFFGMPIEVAKGEVGKLLPTVVLPFNFAKSMLNSTVIMLLYKPLSVALSKAGIGLKNKGKLTWNRNTTVIVIVASAAFLIAMGLLIYLWTKG